MYRWVLLTAVPLLVSACADASAAEPKPNALVPTVIVTRDLPAGAVVTWDDLTQRSVPANLVTKSIAKPDSASFVVNQKLVLPLLKGDPVQWSFIGTLSPVEVQQACAKFEGEEASAEQQVARARQIALSHGH